MRGDSWRAASTLSPQTGGSSPTASSSPPGCQSIRGRPRRRRCRRRRRASQHARSLHRHRGPCCGPRGRRRRRPHRHRCPSLQHSRRRRRGNRRHLGRLSSPGRRRQQRACASAQEVSQKTVANWLDGGSDVYRVRLSRRQRQPEHGCSGHWLCLQNYHPSPCSLFRVTVTPSRIRRRRAYGCSRCTGRLGLARVGFTLRQDRETAYGGRGALQGVREGRVQGSHASRRKKVVRAVPTEFQGRCS